MKKQFVRSAVAILLAATMLVGLTWCKQTPGDDGKTPTKTYDNENDPLVFSTQEVDKVFNPFFSTSATDSNVVGMTQISMLSNDKDGKVVYGDDEAVVVKDLQIITTGTQDVDQTTTYYLVLKNNVRFSNGSYLTIKDVLFNLYVYLDPAYTGSSTIYSTDIVGLSAYRTQTADEKEQESFMLQFQLAAAARISALADAAEEILDNGFALAVVCYTDITADDGDWGSGLCGHYPRKQNHHSERQRCCSPGRQGHCYCRRCKALRSV